MPGVFYNENKSSDVIPNYLSPGIPGYDGLPPTAITILSAVTYSTTPFAFFNSIVWASLNEA